MSTVAAIPRWLLRHRVTVENPLGSNATGPVYDEPHVLDGFVLAQPRQVRDAEGREVTCPATVYLDPSSHVTVGARVTVDGRVATARQVTRHDGGGLPTPDHVEVALE